jgi:hypothetical protein
MLKETTALDIFLIGPYRLHRTVTQAVIGSLQLTDNVLSVGGCGSGPAKSVSILRVRTLWGVSSYSELLLLSVMSSYSTGV